MKTAPQQRWSRLDPDGEARREPSPAQAELWGLQIGGEPDPHGWYNGWCPVHDPEGANILHPTAQFNFVAGVMRCLGDPRCHDRRSVSLTNLLVLMRKGRRV